MIKKLIILTILTLSFTTLFSCSSKKSVKEIVKETQNNFETNEAIIESSTEFAITNNDKNNDENFINNVEIDKITNFPIIRFGTYSKEIGYSDKINWLVLDMNNNSYLLISKEILDCKNYNEVDEYTSWEDSSIRSWLNVGFFDEAFNDFEKDNLVFLNDFYNDNIDELDDKVSLMSLEMCNKFFDNDSTKMRNRKLAATATEFSVSCGVEVETDKNSEFYNCGSFYLRDLVKDNENLAMWVGMFGRVYENGQYVKLKIGDGIRPVIAIKKSMVAENVKEVLENSIKNIFNSTNDEINIEPDAESNVETETNLVVGDFFETENQNDEYEDIDEVYDEEDYDEINSNLLTKYSNTIKDKISSTQMPEKKEDGYIDISNWKYGHTPIEWLYVKPNVQIISNYKPNSSKNFSSVKNASSGSLGCYLTIFTGNTIAYGDDYEARFYCFDDYGKQLPEEMSFKDSFSDFTYKDKNILEILKYRYDVETISKGVYKIGDTYINIIYVEELEDILNNMN